MPTMKKHVAKNRLIVRQEELLAVFNSFFEKFTGLQWRMIKTGVWDSDLQAVFVDMITEIIQSVSARILKIVLPAVQRQMADEESQTHESTALGKVHLSLGHSLSASITSALNIPHEPCDSAEELTKMIEEEILNKVNSAVSLLVGNPELRPKPAVYVSPKVTEVKKLRCMVSQAASYLKRCAGKMSILLSLEEIEMPVTPRHKLIIDEALKAIKNKLHCLHVEDEQRTEAEENAESRQCYNAPEDIVADVINIIIDQLNNFCFKDTAERQQSTKDEAVQCPCTLADMIASEAVIAIIEKLAAEKCVEPEEIDDFNVGLLIEEVRDIFASWTPPTKHDAEKVHKDHFLKFVKKEFEKLIRELKQKRKKNHRFFICLEEPDRSSQDQRSVSKESVDWYLPAADPEIPHSESQRSFRSSLKTPVMEMVVKGCSALDFNTIKPDLDQLFDKLTRKEAKTNEKTLKNVHTMEIKTFSRHLTDKMFDHLQRCHTYPIPRMQQEESLLDSVISRTPHPTGKSNFLPEVFYVAVENSVAKFSQKILLWLENEAVDQTVQSDKISGAVAKIQTAIVRPMKPRKETESDKLSTSIPQSSEIFAPKNKPTSCVTAVQQDLSEERSETAPIAHTWPTVGQSQPIDPRRIVKNFIYLLFLKAFEKSKKITKEARDGEKIVGTIYKLTDLVMLNVKSAESLRILEKNMDNINKATMLRLVTKYGSPKKLLKAALTEVYSFGKRLVKYLNIVLDIYRPPKKSRVARHFSAVGKCFKKLFGCTTTEEQSQQTENPETVLFELSPSPDVLIVTDFIFLLFLRAFAKSKKNIIRAQNGEKVLATITSIMDLVMSKVRSADFLIIIDDNFSDINKTVCKRLFKKFGSPEMFINAALSEDSSFGNTLLKHLNIVVDAYYNPPKTPKVPTSFSLVGKAFTKPLSCCCGCGSSSSSCSSSCNYSSSCSSAAAVPTK